MLLNFTFESFVVGGLGVKDDVAAGDKSFNVSKAELFERVRR